LLCSTGTHRSATDSELRALIGDELVDRYRVKQHVATADDHAEVGEVDGAPILLDVDYLAADVRIITGFVEPHFFAGFSGGPKAVCPGVAALETVLEAHSPQRIADPRATWASTRGNPVHDFVRAAVALAPPTLSVDVAINDDRQVTAVFAGPVWDTHDRACAFVERTAIQKVGGQFDVVVSTNGGYPLDRNLYQAVKGMAAAERVVAPGGTIIMAAECADGLPAGSPFADLLAGARTPDELVHPPGPRVPDGWQTQVLGRVLQRARVALHAGGLTEEDIRLAQLEPIRDVSDAVAASSGRDGRVCVLPFGPLTVATPN
jgi:nickel-dependent lactate racemase